MWNMLVRGWNWCIRFRHRCGYGVHSPADFYLITFVVYESWPYYAYASLHDERKAVETFPHYREKADKLLFRLVNYLRPTAIGEFGTGSGLAARYMAAGCKVPLYTWSETRLAGTIETLLAKEELIHTATGGWQQAIDDWQTGGVAFDFVHLAHTRHYAEIFEALLPQMKPSSCIVVASPYATPEKKRWWKQVIQDTRVGVTFDLYDMGWVFFDFKRVKEHRIVNFL